LANVVQMPLLERLAAAEFGPRQALALRRHLAISPADRKELDRLLAGFERELEGSLPKEEAPVRRGVFLWAIGRQEEADELLRHRRSVPVASFVAGQIRMDQGKFKEAVELFAAAAHGGGDAAVALTSQAECLRRLGEAKEAAEAVTRAAKHAAGAAEVLCMQGRLAEDDGDQQKALDLYESALRTDPENPEANFRSAWILDLRGLDAEAVERYGRVAGGSSLFVSALINLGLLHDESGEFEKSIACFEQALRLDPTNERVRLYLSDAVASTEMYYDEAQEKEQERMEALLRTQLTDFEMSVRGRNCLVRLGCKTLGDLIKHTEEDLLSHKNFGETSLQEIKDLLASKGLYLGMGRDEERRRRARARLGPSDNPVLNRPVADLGLSVRGRACMQKLGVITIGDLVSRAEKDLLGVKNFGQTSLREIRDKLTDRKSVV
jgi:DNA-directed RNA polymerase subunit alpha